MTRLFVAVIPPPEVVEDLDEFLDVRRDAATFRWSDPDQWHVTLAFSGDVPDRSLDVLGERLAHVARRRSPFDLRIAGGGAFPDPDRARVLHARLVTEPAAALEPIAAACRSAVSTAGARADGQRFRPHLTVARIGRPASVTSWVRLLDAYSGPGWTVDEIALVESNLGGGPRRRPRHEVVGTYPLDR